MKKTKIARAIAYVIAGTALTAGAVSTASAASTTMYNLYRGNYSGLDSNGFPIYTATSTTPCSPCGNSTSTPTGVANDAGGWTDGWVWSANPQLEQIDPLPNPPSPVTPIGERLSNASPGRPGWVGIGGSSTPTLTTPFGYAAGGTLNWAVELTGGAGGTAQISNADAIARYSQSADIDTAQGAWSDAVLSGAAGWRHDLDFGLFKSDTSGPVTLSLTGVNNTGSNFGFTIFKGMNSSTNSYNHHGAWNAGTNTQAGAPNSASVPVNNAGGFNLTATNIVAYSIGSATPINLNTITFNAIAGQIYTIALGGYKMGNWSDTLDGYKLSVSQVPAPVCKFTPTGGLTGVPSSPPLLNGLTFEVGALVSGSNISNIASLTCQKTKNIDVAGMVFSPAASSGPVGTPPAWTFVPNSSTLRVTARRAATGSSGTLACTVQDSSGNVCTTDPIIEQAVRIKGEPRTTRILDGDQPLSATYQYLMVKNGSQGLKELVFKVNGKKFKLTDLRNNAIYYLNIGSALRSDVPNDVTMTAKGKPGSSASVFFSDEPLR